jgi:hypothetical protein
MASRDEHVARLIEDARAGTGATAAHDRIGLAAHLRGSLGERTEPAAREWLRLWRPTRSPGTAVLRACACATGLCPVCN